MSPDGVYENDMSKYTDDQWPADDPALAALAEDLRIVASGPAPEPRPGLVAVMRQGAVPIESPTAGRSKKMLVKTLLGSLAAKTALGLGVAAASVTAAGAAGVLPAPAQEVVASVVSAATPFELRTPSDVTTLATDDTEDTEDTTTTTSTSTTLPGTGGGDNDDTGGDSDETRKINHGACVSAAARTNTGEGNHGRTVSSIARSDCGKTDPTSGTSTTSTTVDGSTTSTSVTSTTVDDGQRSANSGRGNSGNSGNSGNRNSGNSGNNPGNSGNAGNSGKGNPGRS